MVSLSGKKNKTEIKAVEGMNEEVCKKLNGTTKKLSNGEKVCYFPRDKDTKEPVDVDIENITPEVQEKAERISKEDIQV